MQLKKNLGVKVEVKQMEWATLLSELDKKRIGCRLAGWSADYLDPVNFLSDLYMTHAPLNRNNYSNPEFDKLCTKADADSNTEERLKLYAQAEDILLQDAAVIPLFTRKHYYLQRSNVEGLHNNLLGLMPFRHLRFKP
jgi:oligopeptide transport system substrate-binding protein